MSTFASANVDLTPPTSYAQRIETAYGDIAELTYESLDEHNRISQAIDCVRRDDAGAITTFLGTTRDNFQGELAYYNPCYDLACQFPIDCSWLSILSAILV